MNGERLRRRAGAVCRPPTNKQNLTRRLSCGHLTIHNIAGKKNSQREKSVGRVSGVNGEHTAVETPSMIVAMHFIFLCGQLSEGRPTVSLIMPTNGRPEFVIHALAMINRQQDVGVHEVVIVDDSPSHTRVKGIEPGWQDADLAGGKLRVNYIVLQEQLSIGAKRNLAVEAATGDLIAHWDDDDYYSPRRLAEQLQPIIDGEADLTVLAHEATYLLAEDELYVAATPLAYGWGPHFGTLAYRRSVAERVAFSDTSEALS